MNEKLYQAHPYTKEWDTHIVNKIEDKDGFWVELKENYFYPEGGGQPSDKGTIENQEIIDIKEENDITYIKIKELPSNDKVRCELDFETRLAHTQHHSGQHILSTVFKDIYDGNTVGFHLGEDNVTVDIDRLDLTDAQIENVESIANDWIYRNLEVKTYVVTKEDIEKLPMRRPPKVDENIRIVQIGDTEYSACCGTHVKRTGEIGIIKIWKKEKQKNKTRIYFRAGQKALKDYNEAQELLGEMSEVLGAGRSELLIKIDKMQKEVKQCMKDMGDILKEFSSIEGEKAINNATSKVITIEPCERDFAYVQLLAQDILAKGEYVVVLPSIKDNKVLVAHNGDMDVHVGKIFKEHVKAFNGKGGGGDKQAQAMFNSADDLKAFSIKVEEEIRKTI